MTSDDYPDYFLKMDQIVTTDTTTLQRIESWSADGYLWGRLEQLSASEINKFLQMQMVVEGKIILHNTPILANRDRLIDQHNNYVWEIDGFTISRTETICYVHRNEVTT